MWPSSTPTCCTQVKCSRRECGCQQWDHFKISTIINNWCSDAIEWGVLSVIRLNEDDTTSSSRIFIKILFQVRSIDLILIWVKLVKLGKFYHSVSFFRSWLSSWVWQSWWRELGMLLCKCAGKDFFRGTIPGTQGIKHYLTGEFIKMAYLNNSFPTFSTKLHQTQVRH